MAEKSGLAQGRMESAQAGADLRRKRSPVVVASEVDLPVEVVSRGDSINGG